MNNQALTPYNSVNRSTSSGLHFSQISQISETASPMTSESCHLDKQTFPPTPYPKPRVDQDGCIHVADDSFNDIEKRFEKIFSSISESDVHGSKLNKLKRSKSHESLDQPTEKNHVIERSSSLQIKK